MLKEKLSTSVGVFLECELYLMMVHYEQPTSLLTNLQIDYMSSTMRIIELKISKEKKSMHDFL